MQPEKVAKSKRFVSVLQKLASCGRLCRSVAQMTSRSSLITHIYVLARIVIDEARKQT
jgi:hypothetical protein